MLIRKFGKISRVLHSANKVKFYFSKRFNSFKINPNHNYYEWLMVGKDASLEQIQKSYNRLVKEAASLDDKQASQQRLKNITEAYNILSDQNIRKQYNKLRFIAQLDQKMNKHSGSKSNTSQSETKSNQYSDLTPEQQKIGQKIAKKVKIFLMFAIALSIFGPFIFWRGNSNNQINNIDQANYDPKRQGGKYLNRLAPRDSDQTNPQFYQEHSNTRNYKSMNPQGYTITGQIIED